jgi:hypothetical protein
MRTGRQQRGRAAGPVVLAARAPTEPPGEVMPGLMWNVGCAGHTVIAAGDLTATRGEE